MVDNNNWLFDPDFPRSNNYDPAWIAKNAMGPNPLWLTEWISGELGLEPGMRVLDMGCGKAISSIFLAKEYGVTVFANDLWIDPTKNLQRVKEWGLDGRVFPLRAEAHSLPYAKGFFDAILSADSYHYYGTDEIYITTFIQLLKPTGRIGIAQVGLTREIQSVPEYLKEWWQPDMVAFHTAQWWRSIWERSGMVDVISAQSMPRACQKHIHFLSGIKSAGLLYCGNADTKEQQAFERDGGQLLTFVKAVGKPKGTRESEWSIWK